MPRRNDRAEGPAERPAVRTTIVGGRPPQAGLAPGGANPGRAEHGLGGKSVGEVPRGIEVLVKKAAVDIEFRTTLLEKRAKAAKEIGLDLDPAEAAMLDGVPTAQLEAIVAGTKVDEKARPAFLGKAAAVMIAALGVGTVGCEPSDPGKGCRADKPKGARVAKAETDEGNRPIALD